MARTRILFKKQLFDLEVKGQGPTKVIMVRDIPPYGHATTYQISLTYLERQKSYGPDKFRWEEAEEAEAETEAEEEKIRLKQYVSLRSKGRHNNRRKIKSFREAGYAIVYMDETWVNQNHSTDYTWLPNDGSDSPKIPSVKANAWLFCMQVREVRVWLTAAI